MRWLLSKMRFAHASWIARSRRRFRRERATDGSPPRRSPVSMPVCPPRRVRAQRKSPGRAVGFRAGNSRTWWAHTRRGGPRCCCRYLPRLRVAARLRRLVDTFDRLDLASVVAAGVDLDRLLWIRGHAISRAQGSGLRPQSGAWAPGPDALVDRTIERALKALNLVLQAGGFGVVALDLADASPAAVRRIPFTTWLRVQRTIEGSDTACVLVASQPLARSAGGLTLALDGRTQWAGQPRPQTEAGSPRPRITLRLRGGLVSQPSTRRPGCDRTRRLAEATGRWGSDGRGDSVAVKEDGCLAPCTLLTGVRSTS